MLANVTIQKNEIDVPTATRERLPDGMYHKYRQLYDLCDIIKM